MRPLPEPASSEPAKDAIHQHLRDHYGLFWRRKVRLLLVVGEPEQIAAIAPGLAEEGWLEGDNTLLLHGGSLQAEFSADSLQLWQALSRWCALDGVVWALDSAQSQDATALAIAARRLRNLAKALHWHLPLHLWQVCASTWEQAGRATQAVGCRLPARLTSAQLQEQLTQLQQPLRQLGWTQVNGNMAHDFLLRLARDLQAESIGRWQKALAPLLGEFARGVPLRGLWFSLPLAKVARHGLKHHWPQDPAWAGVLAEPAHPGRRLGWPLPRLGYALALGLAALWGAGMLLSFASNRAVILHVQDSLAILEQTAPAGTGQVQALRELVRELDRLAYRRQHGAPWHQRFGLDQTPALLDSLWPRYVEANQRLLRDPAVARLQRQLQAWVELPVDSPARAERAATAYDQLKAYLMLAQPTKADAAFLVKTLGAEQPALWQFYGEQLAANPAWAIEADAALVAQVRQALLGQLGQRNAEASLYQQVLDQVGPQYPALGLAQLVGDTEAQRLFSARASVPGVFTRQAWEGQVRAAIETIASARREQIDWVLSDNPGDIAATLSPEQLRERLTARYFEDYSNAWLDFLNSLRWQPAASLAEVIEQLTLMSDARQSPLIALMNSLAYQGQAGSRGQALADSLLASARQLVGEDSSVLMESLPAGPLAPTFGPLLSLLGKDAEVRNSADSLSLHSFLTRVTSVRLKLQQVSNASDPQAMTQALAQTVFQGKGVDLTDTRDYGSLIAASLGAQWGGVGQTLFVQPLEQAWQRVLQPSAAGLNRQWQRAIVSDWQGAFTGRYPFAATGSDASLPMLGQMIRADAGRIEQFLQRELGGVLRKEGSRWLADPRHSQGLRFEPRFLAAINQLSQLADVLYTDGGMGLSFELSGKPVRDVVQTRFVLDGQAHHYFNQKESWQRFAWPGLSDRPGTSLTWTSVDSGERLFGDYQGTWGLIRWLEQAQVTPLDDGDSRYRLVLKAPDGLGLTWHLRTELGAGPLALLKLRGFTLPPRIFMEEGGAVPAYAYNGSHE
nr:ImcF-related family protein [Pseudomonas sp. BGr12]MDL2423416.1 type VI secretion protein VasK [Pseudomonas sp. BGr12]